MLCLGICSMSKKKSKVTEYMDLCLICNNPNIEVHHLLEGIANRKLSDEDDLVIPLCREHHQGKESVHKCKIAMVLSHCFAEAIWERNYILEKLELPFADTLEEARTEFRKRYGKNFF